MNKLRRTRRIPLQIAVWGVLFLCALICIVSIMYWISTSGDQLSSSKLSLVVATEPIEIWSIDTETGSMTCITIPSDVSVDSLWGYGVYSLEALWKLGDIDKKSGTLLADSVSEALGLPVTWYIGPSDGTLWKDGEAHSANAIFTTGHGIDFITGYYRTNITPRQFIYLTKMFSSRSAQTPAVYAFNDQMIGVVEELPDGSERYVLDPERLDYYLKGVFIDEEIRKDNLTVSVLNTTSTPLLGNRAARYLTRMGIMVVGIGNDQTYTDTCMIRGDKAHLATKTATEIQALLRCQKEEAQSEERSDLTVYIGGEFEKRYK